MTTTKKKEKNEVRKPITTPDHHLSYHVLWDFLFFFSINSKKHFYSLGPFKSFCMPPKTQKMIIQGRKTLVKGQALCPLIQNERNMEKDFDWCWAWNVQGTIRKSVWTRMSRPDGPDPGKAEASSKWRLASVPFVLFWFDTEQWRLVPKVTLNSL